MGRQKLGVMACNGGVCSLSLFEPSGALIFESPPFDGSAPTIVGAAVIGANAVATDNRIVTSHSTATACIVTEWQCR
jgi:hypothetical protein